MRTNLPVTQREHPFPDGATLLSATDLDSRVSYANEAFVDISGFERDELIGQTHNLVRHPDMPPEAFGDMWRTIRSGQTWTALVKNRRKDGDHYWVRANVAPIRKDGRIAGYLSVRTRPSRNEVEAAEHLYAEMREGRAGITLDRGVIVGKGWRRILSVGRLMSGAARALAAALACGALGTAAMVPLALSRGLTAPETWLALGGLWLAAVLAGAWLHRQFVVPLRSLLEQAQLCASGQRPDVINLPRVDEIGLLMRAINQCGLNTRSLIDDVRRQVDGITESGDTLADGAGKLSSRTSSSAASLEQTASAMEQMSSAIRTTADKAREAETAARGAAVAASEGSREMSRVDETMRDIEKAGERIGSIIGVIDSIAFQTNILALNAAVEAARAGEQGRGFAVVASEVRSLAQRCAQAATEVKSLVAENASSTAEGCRRVGDVIGRVKAASRHVEDVAALIAEISVASSEQTRGIGQVNLAIGELDAGTQGNAQMVDQCASITATLQTRARLLENAIATYG